MNNGRTFFIALIFLAVIVACVLPGLPTASTPAPAPPTIEPGRVETMVAETVSAAIALTEQARPVQPPTDTPVPTATASATPVPVTIAATGTPEVISSVSALTVQVDGSTVFVDERAGYEITVPAAWLVMRVNEQEYLDVWQLAEAADENIQQSLFSVQNEDPNILRLFAIDAQEGHVQNGFVTNMKFVLDEKNSISLENDNAFGTSLTQSVNNVPGLEVLSAKLSTINGMPVGLIELKSMTKNLVGAEVVVFQKQAVFNAARGKMVITLSTVETLKETLFPD